MVIDWLIDQIMKVYVCVKMRHDLAITSRQLTLKLSLINGAANIICLCVMPTGYWFRTWLEPNSHAFGEIVDHISCHSNVSAKDLIIT